MYCASWAPPPELSVEEAKACAGHLRGFMEPAPREMIIILLSRLAAHFWGEKDAGHWKLILEDYSQDLGEYPLDLVSDAIAAVRKTVKFWPKVSEILKFIEPLYQERKLQYERLCRAGKIDIDMPQQTQEAMNVVKAIASTFIAKSAEAMERAERDGDDRE